MRKRVGDILLESGVIDNSELEDALSYQKGKGVRLGTALVEMGYLTEEGLIGALSSQLGVEIIDIEDIEVDENVLKYFGEDFLKKNICLPFSIEDGLVNVVV